DAPEAGQLFQRIAVAAPAGGTSFDTGNGRAEKVIGPEGGTLSIPGGHTLTFPAGGLSQATTIRARVDAQYVAVELEPHGIRFPAGRGPALTLSYAGTNAESFSRLVTLYVGDSNQVEEILNVENNPAAGTATVRLQHFSRYYLAGN
ncbi:MAG TPA: hypothetical protein VFQ76_05275, partial [Longimicrobiaceae bacterium]|nr:hypothetical protein [Longimicrobiaceae bacterium]